jgi:hypothetical protein
MIVFEEITELPPEAPQKAQWQAQRSMFMWRVRYVCQNEFGSHTNLGTFGFVPMCYMTQTGYFWLAPEVKEASRSALREAKRAFLSFTENFGWTSYVFTEVDFTVGLRFARFMGFNPIGSDEHYTYLARDK